MKKRTWFLVCALSAALVAAPGAQAQVNVGGQLLYNNELSDGSMGIGGRVGVELPVAGLQVRADGNWFFPDCGAGLDCDFWELLGSVSYGLLPASPAQPYVGAGISYQNLSSGGADLDETGFNILGGVELGGLLPVNVFAELAYRMMGDFNNQFMLSTGVLF